MTNHNDRLLDVLALAYSHAMGRGSKGMTRHGEGKPFDQQVWSVITKTVGLGFPLGQAWKKWDEAKRLIAAAHHRR